MPQRIKCPAENNSNQWQYLGCSQISQSWVIVQPQTSDCQLSTEEELQFSTKIWKNLKAWSFLSFFKKSLNLSHNYNISSK